MQTCHIDLPRCIGCTLCAQVCPWDVITMVPSDQMLREERFAKEFAD
jgi:formate hydrogenlyase subunit 6/NADH:ubiquinone oxidoreductase subunit I